MRANRIAPFPALALGVIAYTAALVGAPVDNWVLEKITTDENVLRSAVEKTDGRDFRLLEQSTTYVPFFLEGPELDGNPGNDNASSMFGFFARKESTFLAGGYLYRIDFGTEAPLYGLSSGEWDGSSWYSPEFGKEIEIDPLKVWSGQDGSDFSYASILSGVPPRLVVFDRSGDIREERDFDVSNPNISSVIEAVAASYATSGEPTVEMVSLAEYLRSDEPSWRTVEITSSFNFRKQHERPGEIKRLSEVGELTRGEAIRALRSRENTVVENGDQKPEIGPSHGIGMSSIQNNPRTGEEEVLIANRSRFWLFIVGATAVLAILFLLIRAFLRGRVS